MDLRVSCWTILGRRVRRLRERYHAQMRIVLAAALDDLPDYHVKVNHGGGPVVIIQHEGE